MSGNKRYTKKQVQKALGEYEKQARSLLRSKDKLDKQLTGLDKYIADNGTKIDKIGGVASIISLVKDESNHKYTDSSAELVIDALNAILLIMDNLNISGDGIEYLGDGVAIPNDVVIRYIKRNYAEEMARYSEWCKWEKNGEYPLVPTEIINKQEQKSLDSLAKRYEKLTSPSALGKVTDKLKDIVPEKVLRALEEVGHNVSDAELYKRIMEIITDGFDTLLKYSSKVTISEETIVRQINESFEDNHIFNWEEVCYARGYDISKLVNKFKTQNIYVAFAEGGATGVVGLPGIVLNMATSTFIFYRAIQSIAMYYGYDVKNNTDELELATEVFMQAMDPTRDSSSEIGSSIAKFMAMSEALVVKSTIKKGWQAMAERGGLCLLITQIRAMANTAAEKAIIAAGERGLELKLFDGVLKALGKKLTQKAVFKGVSPAAAIITALMDVSTMKNVVEYADVFYNKRFLFEKQTRIDILQHPEVVSDVEYEVVESE